MKIYRGNNVEVFDIEIDDSSSINNRMMIENTLSVSVDAPDPIDFAIGDYTVVQGERYELHDIPQVDITNDTYSYDALFLGNIHRPDNYLMEQGSAPSHNFTGTLDDHVKYIVGIINTKDSGGWSYAIGDTEGVDTSFKDINYSSMSCLAALSQVATDYGVEYDITLQHIEVAKKIQRSSSFEFAVGRGKGLYKISRGKVSNQRIATRLIALGGTTNMMYGASLALDEVFVESNVEKYGLREEKVTFEWIYPRCNSKITSDATVSETDSKVWSVSDSALDFDLNLQTIEDPKIVFTTGECAGIGFSIKSYDHLTKTVLFSEFADSEPNSGNAVPNPNRRPKAGDGYNFINIIMPDSYTVRAKAELRAAAVAELSKVSVPQSPYTIEIDPRFIKSMGRKPVCGDLVRIINSSIGLDRHIRVISCTSSVKNEDDVQIVVNDDLLSSSASSLSRSVGQIKEYISQNKVDLGGKLDSRTFYREFAPQATCLRALRNVYYDGAVMVNSVEMPGGGMLPPGVAGDILAWSAEQSLWLGRQYTEFGFLTAETLSKYVPEWAMSATKPSYVIGEIGGAEAWLTGKGFATVGNLALKLDKAVWDDAFSIEKVGKILHAKLPVYFDNEVVVSATNSGAVGGTSDYTQLENLPTIGGITVIGAKTLSDYGLDLSGYALTSQIPNMNGYATQTWVTGKGYLTSSSLNGYATESWVSGKLALYLPLSGGTISGALTVNGVSTFNDAVVVSATNSGAVGGTGDYTQLENLPTIGGVTVMGAKTLNDYGLVGYLSGYALTSQIPSLSGYATQSWVTSLGYVTAAHDHDTVRGVYMGNGANAQFPPDYIQKSTVKFNMRVTKVFTTSVYCDVMSMDCYYGSDIPYVTMMGITKTASPSAFIASGPKNSSDNNSWVYRKLACMDEIQALYLPLTGGTISGALTVNGVSTFNDAVVVSATNSGAVGGTGDYTQLENLPTIGGVTVIGAKTLNDYGLASYLSSYALTSQIPSLSGYATQSWVTSLGYVTAAHDHDTVRGVYMGNGGEFAPSYIINKTVRFNMRKHEQLFGYKTYADTISMDCYHGNDVPYVTAIGVTKELKPRALIASGKKGETSNIWAYRQLACMDELPTLASLGGIPTTASCNKNWNWVAKDGQPNWMWGGNDKTNMYIYSPLKFNVNTARRLAPDGYTVGDYDIGATFNDPVVGYFNLQVKSPRGSVAHLNHVAVGYAVGCGNADTIDNYHAAQLWRTDNFNPADYLPLTGGTITGALTVSGLATFNDAVVVSATNSGAVGGTSDYMQLENLPTIGGVTVIGAKTLNDYGLVGYLSGYALTSQIPSLSGYATQSWVTSQGFATAITKAQVLGVMTGSGVNTQYLAGNGTFYAIRYSEIGGTPDLSGYATQTWVTSKGYLTTSSLNGYIKEGDSRLTDYRKAIDVYAWAKQANKPSYTYSEVGAISKYASCNKNWNWTGKNGQPPWLWGGEGMTDMFVYDPSNFSVSYAKSAGNADTVDNYHAAQLWRTDNFNPAEYLPLTGGTISGALTVNGTTTFNGAVVVSA